jgi:hypothetical protein
MAFYSPPTRPASQFGANVPRAGLNNAANAGDIAPHLLDRPSCVLARQAGTFPDSCQVDEGPETSEKTGVKKAARRLAPQRELSLG